MLTSALVYQDVDAAIDWLCAALGFSVHFVARDADGAVMHAQLRHGDALLFLGPEKAGNEYGMHSPRSLNGCSQCICIALADPAAVDAHHARALAAGAEMINVPRLTEYGAYEYSCRDPEGNAWSISDYFGEP
jgi:uncharacterized glyoxalase superfamily protein PhnB